MNFSFTTYPSHIYPKIFEKKQFHPYKMRLVRVLNEADPDRPAEFFQSMMEMITENPQFLGNVFYLDEEGYVKWRCQSTLFAVLV